MIGELIRKQDALKIRVSEGINENGVLYVPFRDVCAYINNLPSVDAVEVVRCKDCIHFDGECCDRYADETLGYSHSTQPNFFCACVERKTDV